MLRDVEIPIYCLVAETAMETAMLSWPKPSHDPWRHNSNKQRVVPCLLRDSSACLFMNKWRRLKAGSGQFVSWVSVGRLRFGGKGVEKFGFGDGTNEQTGGVV